MKAPLAPKNKVWQHKINQIGGWLSKEEGLLLYHLALVQSGKGVIVEIGSFHGKSTIYLGSAARETGCGKIYAIDPHVGEVHKGKKEYQSSFQQFTQNINKFDLSKWITPLRSTSMAAYKTWSKTVSLLFIDGLHDRESVLQDIRWINMLQENGVVAFHDALCPFPDVFNVIKEKIFNSGQFRYISFTNSIIYAVKGKPLSVYETFILYYNTSLLILTGELWHSNVSESLKIFLVSTLKKCILKEKVLDENFNKFSFVK